MPNLHSIGNQLEASVWFLVALVCLFKAPRDNSNVAWLGIVAAAAFVLFGVSDIVEIQTGAWWRPWWLLAWKAGCVLTFVWLWWKTRQVACSEAENDPKNPADRTTK